MRIFKRTDVPHAYVVLSGPETYHVYTGPDVSLPRCSCAAHIYTDTRSCRHQKAVEALCD